MYRLKIVLKQHTPLIHFQGTQPGACLRASEVKTKLDRFLLNNYSSCFKNGNPFDSRFFIDSEHKALNYKLRIRPVNGVEHREVEALQRKNGTGVRYVPVVTSYFAPAVEDKTEKTKPVKFLWFGELEAEFFSYDCCLLNAIKKCAQRFFAVTNFGARTSKGFGSFTVSKIIKDGEIFNIESCSKDLLIGRTYIKFEFNDIKVNPCNRKQELQQSFLLLEYAYTLYQVLKSGINHKGYEPSFLVKRYWHSKHPKIRAEKAFIKSNVLNNGCADCASKSEEEPVKMEAKEETNSRPNNQNYRYVRAMLGLAPHTEFRLKYNDGKIKILHKDKDKDKDKSVERFRSPVTIKIIDNNVYFIAEEIPEALFGKEFQFSKDTVNQSEPSEPPTIKTPSKDEFNLLELLCGFAQKVQQDKNNKSLKSAEAYNTVLERLNDVKFVTRGGGNVEFPGRYNDRSHLQDTESCK